MEFNNEEAYTQIFIITAEYQELSDKQKKEMIEQVIMWSGRELMELNK